MDERVSIRAHFERFPATLKGAFVLRGADADPHQVRIEAARVTEMSGRGGQPMGVEPVTLDVAPHLDLFVPFEVPLLDLGPGWYRLELEVVIDGVADVVHPGERFAMAWPRGSMRRGSVSVRKVAEVASTSVTIEQVECTPDTVRVTYSAPARVAITIAADGTTLSSIEDDFDPEAGKGRAVVYPVAKTQTRLSVSVRGAAEPVEIDLP